MKLAGAVNVGVPSVGVKSSTSSANQGRSKTTAAAIVEESESEPFSDDDEISRK